MQNKRIKFQLWYFFSFSRILSEQLIYVTILLCAWIEFSLLFIILKSNFLKQQLFFHAVGCLGTHLTFAVKYGDVIN